MKYFPRKLNWEQIEKIINLKMKGWSFPQIAKKYKIDHTTIVNLLQRLGIKDYPRSRRGPKPKKKFIIKPPLKKEMKKDIGRYLKPTKQYADYLKEADEVSDPIKIAKQRYSQNRT